MEKHGYNYRKFNNLTPKLIKHVIQMIRKSAMEEKYFEILELLSEDSYCSSVKLSEKLGISEKTARTRIKELDQRLETFGATITSKRGLGYSLVVTDQKQFLESVNQSSKNRSDGDVQDELFRFLLDMEDYQTIDDISAQLYISRSVLTNHLKKIEALLKLYDLSIDRKPHYGIKIIGSEANKRTCIQTNNLYPLDDRDLIRKLMDYIIVGNQKYQVYMSEVAMEALINYIMISISRIKHHFPIEHIKTDRQEISQASQKIISDYINFIFKETKVYFNQYERDYLALQFTSKLASNSLSKFGPNFIISSQIDQLTFEMLDRVYKLLNLDFRNNLELRMALSQHLVPMDIRLRYNIMLENPLSEQIQKEYPFPYTIASTAVTVLNEFYQKDISQGEMAYIALIFALATEKRNRDIAKKNILLVCISGTSSSQLFKYKYLQAFGDYINKVYESSVSDLDFFDFKGNHIDYIFTTVPLSKKYPIPIYEINLFIDTNDILTYKQFFEEGEKNYLLDYYSTNLFLPHLKASTKEDALKQMCQHISHYGLTPDGFYEAVLQRESLGQTAFGDIALPHPYKVLTEKSFVCVAILEEPIFWETKEIQVIFLMSIGKEKADSLEEFYKTTSNIMFNEEAVKALIETPTFENLLQQLK